jgi:hypothetical protein
VRSQRLIGAIATVAGVVVAGFDPNRFDRVLVALPRGHGVHTHDVLGVVLVAIGITLLWLAPPRKR